MVTSSMRMFTRVTAMMTAIGEFCDAVPAMWKECMVDCGNILKKQKCMCVFGPHV